MRSLLLLSALVAVSYAAPQFVFILPHGFDQLLQPGATPSIKPVVVNQQATSPAEAAPEAKTLLESEPVPELSPAPEADPTAVASPEPEVVFVEEIVPVSEADPALESAAPEVIPAEEVITALEAEPTEQVDATPLTDSASETAIPLVDIVADPVLETAAAAPTEVQTTQVITPVEVVAEVAPAREAVIAVESLPAVVSSVHNKIIPAAPAVNLIDPLAHVDPRFRSFIYPNDAPDVVAAKVELFRVHASRVPSQKSSIVF